MNRRGDTESYSECRWASIVDGTREESEHEVRSAFYKRAAGGEDAGNGEETCPGFQKVLPSRASFEAVGGAGECGRWTMPVCSEWR